MKEHNSQPKQKYKISFRRIKRALRLVKDKQNLN